MVGVGKRIAVAIVFFWGVGIGPALGGSGEPVAAKRLFHLTFDGQNPLVADEAAGNPQPVTSDGVQVVEGLRGKGVFLSRQSVLAYAEPGNLDKARGSLEIWFKPSFERDAFAEEKAFYPCLFKEDAPLGPVETNPVNNIWLWFARGQLRYDLRVATRNDVRFAGLPGELKDVWRQVVITWDADAGMEMFVNGQRMPCFMSDRPVGLPEPVRWTPQAHPRFFLGNRGRDTYHTAEPLWGGCECVLDEVTIYDRPLSEAEVLCQYGRAFGDARGAPSVLARRAAMSANQEQTLVLDVRNPYPFELQGRLEIILGERTLSADTVRLKAHSQTTVTTPALRLDVGTHPLRSTFNGVTIHRQPLTALSPPATRPLSPPTRPARYEAASLRGTDAFRESAPSRLAALNGLTYVECGARRFDRIAFRFQVRHPRKPHLLKLFYPDDAERIFDVVINGPSAPCAYDTQGGVVTGKEFENTHGTQSYEMLYWPREKDQALILTTWAAGRPAAVSAFEVHELGESLPPLRLASAEDRRSLGLYWEDPMLSECFGGRHHETDSQRFIAETADRLVEYLRWTGMNTLIYPVAFYQGPGFATLAENLVAGSGAERHPFGYIDTLLRRFEAAGDLEFIPEINFCMSPSMLLPIREFAQTPEKGYVAVSNQGKLHTGMFPRLNVAHPLYQERLTEIVRDMCQRWGDSPSFRGIQLHLVIESSFWFGGPEWGYDDFTVGSFRQETGLSLPDFRGEQRCPQRFEWLKQNAWERWVDWRCEKVTQFYSRLAKALAETRPDLKLVIGLRYMSEGDRDIPRWLAAGRRMSTVYREGGLDFTQLAAIPNLVLQKYFYPNDMAWRTSHQPGHAHYAGLEMRRSHELRTTLTLAGAQPVATNLYVDYFESDVDKRNPIQNFWWGAPTWRVCGPTPSGRNFLEAFAESVALYDAPFITTGGFIVGTLGHDAHVQEFARAYRALPAVPFQTVPGASDVAVVRVGKGGYLYVVSRAPFPVTLTLRFARPGTLVELSDERAQQGQSIQVTLQPYQLRSFRAQGEWTPADIAIQDYVIPASRKESLEAAMALLLTKPAPGPAVAEELRGELHQLHYVRCKHILEGVRTLDLLGPTPTRKE